MRLVSWTLCRSPFCRQVLTLRGFRVEQYLLSPVHLGIPNTRLRYFCLASRCGVEGEEEVGPIQESLPCHISARPPASSERAPGQEKVHVRPLSEYLVRGAARRNRLFATMRRRCRSCAAESVLFVYMRLCETFFAREQRGRERCHVETPHVVCAEIGLASPVYAEIGGLSLEPHLMSCEERAAAADGKHLETPNIALQLRPQLCDLTVPRTRYPQNALCVKSPQHYRLCDQLAITRVF